MTHWDIAQACIAGIFLSGVALAGWIVGGMIYLG